MQRARSQFVNRMCQYVYVNAGVDGVDTVAHVCAHVCGYVHVRSCVDFNRNVSSVPAYVHVYVYVPVSIYFTCSKCFNT